jgi:hypothetical protein
VLIFRLQSQKLCIQIQRLYSETILLDKSKIIFRWLYRFHHIYSMPFWYMIHLFQIHFSHFNFCFFFFSNHKIGILWHWSILKCFRGCESIPKIVSGWLYFSFPYFRSRKYQTPKLPITFTGLMGMVLPFEKEEWKTDGSW